MIGNLTVTPRRRIGGLNIQCTIEEQHDDALTVTDHPVERGALISDHAFKNPAQLTIRAGWSNSTLAAGFNESYVRDIYDKLLALQESREPLEVVTGKRVYEDMLITALAVTTDEKSETALMVTATLREIIRVQTRVVSVPPAAVQASPQATAATAQTGAVQPRPATLSPPTPGG